MCLISWCEKNDRKFKHSYKYKHFYCLKATKSL